MRQTTFRRQVADIVIPMIGASLGVAIALNLPVTGAAGTPEAGPVAQEAREADVQWLSLPEDIAPESWGFK